MKFEFMASSDGYDYTIEFLCENLDVSKSGYYKWRQTRPARLAKAQRDYIIPPMPPMTQEVSHV